MRACHLLSRISTFAHPVLTTLNALPTHPARTGLGACPCSGHLLLPQQVLAQRMRGFGVCRKEDMKTILTLHFCTSSAGRGAEGFMEEVAQGSRSLTLFPPHPSPQMPTLGPTPAQTA